MFFSDLGLAQFNMAHQKLSAVRGMIKEYTPNGPLILRDLSSLDDLLERTGDTWVVLYFDSSVFAASNVNEESAAAFRNIKTQWAALSVLARDTYNVAALDIAGKYTVQPLEDQLREEDLRAVKLNRTLIRFHKVTTASMYRVDDFHTFIALPTMKLHRGKVSQLVQDEDFDADIEGLDYDGDLGNVEFINELVVREMEADVLAPGSVESVPARLRRDFQEALRNMQ